jgi:hypothetical protein
MNLADAQFISEVDQRVHCVIVGFNRRHVLDGVESESGVLNAKLITSKQTNSYLQQALSLVFKLLQFVTFMRTLNCHKNNAADYGENN